jgi:small GTP-binding protein
MSSSKIKLQLKFQGAVLDRKCVFFRPCHPNQIADAVRIICGLQDAHARFSLLDEDGDLVAISDSLAPGVYEVVLDNNDSNSSINNHNSINNSHSSSSTSSTSSASSTNSSSSSYGNGNISGANNSSCHPRNTRGSRNPRQHTSSFTSASTASSGAAGARRLASSEASVSTASDNRRPSSSSSSASGFPRGSGNRGYPPPNNPYHQDHRGDGENRTSASHSNNSRRASSASASGSGTGGVSKRDTANTSSSSEWDRRSNQVQREDIARRSFRAASNPHYDGLEYKYLFKFIIVGNMSVGKSCLLMRFADNQFKENHEATIGVDFGSQIINVGGGKGKHSEPVPVKIQIWDTAGQEDFRAITRAYYREACAALLVYDSTNRQSFSEVKTWLEAVRNNSTNDNIVLTLVGNKSDLCGRHTGSRRVKRQEGERFADTHGLLHVETSAKTGENVTEAFLSTALTVLEKVRTGQVDVRDSASGVRLNTSASGSGRYGGGGGGGGGSDGRRGSRGESLGQRDLDSRKGGGGCC